MKFYLPRESGFHLFQVVVWLGVFCYLLSPSVLFAQSESERKTPETLGQLSDAFEALAERVSPAVVQIVATGYSLVSGDRSNRANMMSRRHSGGAGVILDPDGYIVTNAHVLDGAYRVRVLLAATIESPSRALDS